METRMKFDRSRLARLAAALLSAAALAGCAAGAGQGGALAQAASTPESELLTRAQFTANDGEAARTEALYIAVLRKVPSEADTWYRLGNLYANNNRPEPAAAAYARALLADNGNARAYHNLAIIRMRQAYAALLQGQMSVPADDEALARRIDELIDELGRVSALTDQARPRASSTSQAPQDAPRKP
jgi:cytochrome c-type biogenesis protein CcmH/NrfG